MRTCAQSSMALRSIRARSVAPVSGIPEPAALEARARRRYRGDDSLPRSAAENLARARARRSSGRVRQHRSSAWENPDSTKRVLALIGPQLFTITRADDLPRVLGIAQALAERHVRAGRVSKGSANHPAPGDALLEMPEGQVVTLTVENAKLFARGATEHVPERLTVSVAAPAEARVRLRIQADFAGEPQAEAAHAFWTRRRYHTLVAHPYASLFGSPGARHPRPSPASLSASQFGSKRPVSCGRA